MSWLASIGYFRMAGSGSTKESGGSSGACADASSASGELGESIHPAASLLRGSRVKGGKNVVRSLLRRQQTGQQSAPGSSFTTVTEVIHCFRDRLDVAFYGVPLLVLDLENAIQKYITAHEEAGRPRGVALESEWRAVSTAVSAIMQKLMVDPQQGPPGDAPRGGGQLHADREAFCLFTGPETVLKLFAPPFGRADARELSPEEVKDRSELWNDVLVLLRELCYAVPELGPRLFSPRFVLFLFTLLGHATFFDHCVGLIEEILADQPVTFPLASVPGVASLLRGLSIRQLAHFCRVLALLVFEPEDRHLMESSKVLRSVDILQLRRDRMRTSSTTIDRNHALLLGIPDLLPRLVHLLQIMNYSPPLAQLSHSQIVANFPPFEMLLFLSNMIETHEWDALPSLCSLAACSPSPSSPSSPTVPSPPPPSSPAPTQQPSGAVRPLMVGELMNVLEPLLAHPPPPDFNIRQIIQLLQTVQALNVGSAEDNPAAPIVLQRLNRRAPPSTPLEASNELQFNALLLTPHQVEVLFVLCTLLGGRRKIDVQTRLADYQVIDILSTMFDRLSWGHETAPEGPNPLERIHGPDCECNPESALRVQFLRLVHNFCDRDCENNPTKHLLLSPEERQRLCEWDPRSPLDLTPPLPSSSLPWSPDVPKGLLSKIMAVLRREKTDSIYRFWLSSCVESFLRGSSPKEQVFVAESGMLRHLLSEILSDGLLCAGSLQSSFDLLGELTKCNRRILEAMTRALSDADLRKLVKVVSENLIDSNVFVRSLLLSLHSRLDFLSSSSPPSSPPLPPTPSTAAPDQPGYLTHSWLDVVPSPLLDPSSPSPYADRPDHSCLFDTWPEETQALRIGACHARAGEGFTAADYAPLRRLMAALEPGLVPLLRDLMCVVDLRSVDHESICTINTATVTFIFLHRRGLLSRVLAELRALQAATLASPPESPRLSEQVADLRLSEDEDEDEEGEEEGGYGTWSKAPAAAGGATAGGGGLGRGGGGCSCRGSGGCGDAWEDGPSANPGATPEARREFFHNFRELLWFWNQYYHHRGRDRLSLEFSSHISFAEWRHVVDLLCADDGSPTALLSQPIELPTSPYSLPPRHTLRSGSPGYWTLDGQY